MLHQLDADLAIIDPRYELRRAARVDNTLVYRTSTITEQPAFARRIGRAQASVRAVCAVCGRPGEPRTRSRTVLCELHWHPLTAAERAFALSADIPAAWFGDDAEAAKVAYIAACEAKDREDAAAHLTEREMADGLKVTVQRVHEMFEHDLLAGADRDGRIVFRRWQLTHDGRPLPHLAAVLRAAGEWDPRSLQAIMENVDEELDGLSPGAVARARAPQAAGPTIPRGVVLDMTSAERPQGRGVDMAKDEGGGRQARRAQVKAIAAEFANIDPPGYVDDRRAEWRE